VVGVFVCVCAPVVGGCRRARRGEPR